MCIIATQRIVDPLTFFSVALVFVRVTINNYFRESFWSKNKSMPNTYFLQIIRIREKRERTAFHFWNYIV
jgi:hypothetical protein